MLQDLRECLDVPTPKSHLIISPSFPGTLGELPIKRKPRDLQRVWGFFCLLPLNRHICRKIEKVDLFRHTALGNRYSFPAHLAAGGKRNLGWTRVPAAQGSSAQDNEAVIPGANEGFQLVGLLQLSSVGQKGCNLDWCQTRGFTLLIGFRLSCCS